MTTWPLLLAASSSSSSSSSATPRKRAASRAATPAPPPPGPPAWVLPLVRDVLLLLAGLWLIIQEASREGEPRFQLLLVYAGMIGLGPVLRADGALAALVRRDRTP